MAGKIELTGKNLTMALKMLRDVTTILELRHIPYCLDGGTLLGIIRENRLLPWDHDLDLYVSADDYKRVKSVIWRFRLLGYWVAVRTHGVDKPPCRLGGPRLVKIRTRAGLFKPGPLNLDIFLKYKSDDHYYWIAGAKRKNVQNADVGISLKMR